MRNSEEHDGARLHALFMEFMRVSGMLLPDFPVPGHQISMSHAFAIHELDSPTPLSQRDLAERLGLEKSTISRMVADLERRGHLVRERDPENRRFYRLRLTPHGRELHATMGSAFHEHYDRWVSAMTKAERDALFKGLSALIGVMRADTGSH